MSQPVSVRRLKTDSQVTMEVMSVSNERDKPLEKDERSLVRISKMSNGIESQVIWAFSNPCPCTGSEKWPFSPFF